MARRKTIYRLANGEIWEPNPLSSQRWICLNCDDYTVIQGDTTMASYARAIAAQERRAPGRSRTRAVASDERYAVVVNGRRRSVWESRNEARLVAERAVAGRSGMTAEVVDRRTGKVIERHDTRGGQSRSKGTVAMRWAEVHAAAAAGHPIRHPREYVFGK